MPDQVATATRLPQKDMRSGTHRNINYFKIVFLTSVYLVRWCTRGCFSLSTIWVLGIELRSPCLAANFLPTDPSHPPNSRESETECFYLHPRHLSCLPQLWSSCCVSIGLSNHFLLCLALLAQPQELCFTKIYRDG